MSSLTSHDGLKLCFRLFQALIRIKFLKDIIQTYEVTQLLSLISFNSVAEYCVKYSFYNKMCYNKHILYGVARAVVHAGVFLFLSFTRSLDDPTHLGAEEDLPSAHGEHDYGFTRTSPKCCGVLVWRMI